MLAILSILVASTLAFPLADVLAPNPTGQNWAVLVAGSNSWGNYRHQADVCHSYQVLVNHGFNKNNIIVMMYDDIAHNSENPTPGVVINAPNGADVYHGVSKDYTGAAVTPANFLNVLKGNAAGIKGGNGKVLGSGPNDNVFVFFSDHGGPGIIAFPSELLQATDLNNALVYMHEHQKYNKLVFYLEACESGSMFNTLLPANINIFATTASDPDTSSYACYYDAKRGTYLGDVYSVNWLENSDKADLSKETLQQQFQVVKRETNTSVVCEYGDQAFSSEPLSNYQGPSHSTVRVSSIPNPNKDAVDSRDVPIAILRHKIAASTGAARAKYAAELSAMMQERAALQTLFSTIVAKAAGSSNVALHMTRRMAPTAAHVSCLAASTAAMDATCLSLSQSDYGLKLSMSFVSMCESGVPASSILAAIKSACPVKGSFVGGVY